MLNPAEKIGQALEYKNAGRFQEAINLWKEAIAELDESTPLNRFQRMLAAAEIVTTMTNMRRISSGGQPPVPGTPEHLEFHKYTKIAVESFERVPPQGQQAFHATYDINMFRGMLAFLEDENWEEE